MESCKPQLLNSPSRWFLRVTSGFIASCARLSILFQTNDNSKPPFLFPFMDVKLSKENLIMTANQTTP